MIARLPPGMPSLFALAMLVQACPAVAQSQFSTLDVAQAAPRLAPTAAAAGEQSKATQVNSWTVGVAGGFLGTVFYFVSYCSCHQRLDPGHRAVSPRRPSAGSSIADPVVEHDRISVPEWQSHFNLSPDYFQTNLLPGILIGRYDARVSAPLGGPLARDGDP